MIKPTLLVEIKDLAGNISVYDASTPAATFKGCLKELHKINNAGQFGSDDQFKVGEILMLETGNKHEAGKMAYHFFKSSADFEVIFKESK